MADSRFPPTPTSHLAEEYKPYGQELYDFVGGVFGENGKLFKYRDENDALIGIARRYPIPNHCRNSPRKQVHSPSSSPVNKSDSNSQL